MRRSGSAGMKANGWRWTVCAALMLVQPIAAAMPEIPRLRILGPAEGLPNTHVTALEIDRDGHLWVGTADGLGRYDGVEFRVWRHQPEEADSLPGNNVQALHVDARGRVWVSTEGSGMSVLEPGRDGFRHYRRAQHPRMGSDDVFAIASHGDDVWFGTYGGGVHRLAPDGRIVRHARALGAGLPSDNVFSLAIDADGTVWAGTDRGLARHDGGGFAPVELPEGAAGTTVLSLLPEEAGLLVGSTHGFFRLTAGGDWETPPWTKGLRFPNGGLAVARDPGGGYWMGRQRGAWRIDAGGKLVPILHDGTMVGATRPVESLRITAEGGVWMSVPGYGLGYLRSDWRRLGSLTAAQGAAARSAAAEGGGESGQPRGAWLAGGLYRAIGAARSAGVWLSGAAGSLEHLDTRSGEIALYPLPALTGKLPVSALLEDRDGRVWIGQRSGALSRWDPATGALRTWLSADDRDPTLDAPLDGLAQAADGSIWSSHLGLGVQQRDGASGRLLRQTRADGALGLESGDNKALGIGADGQPWLANARGLLRWAPERQRFVAVEGVDGARIHTFAFDGEGRLWLHRLAALERHVREGPAWRLERRLSARDGLPAVESTGLAVDAQGRVWLATRRGMLRIDPQRSQVRMLDVRDGLVGQEFLDRALALSADGVLVGGMAEGSVSLLDTTRPDPPPRTARLVLRRIEVTRGEQLLALPTAGGFELRPDDHDLRVGVRLLTFDSPLGSRYRSRLEGFDADWTDQGDNSERVFSTLPAGGYRLRLQAFDAAGNASEEMVLAFRVLPPWWRSGAGLALFALAGLLLAAGLAVAYRDRLRRRTAWQLAEHKRELAEQASLAKTRFLATLGHEVRTPMTGVLGMSELLQTTALDERQRGYVEAIQRAGSHLLRLVNDALDLARIEAGRLELERQDFDLRQLADEMVALMAPMARRKGLEFECRFALPEGHTRYRGDPVRLRQILLNLLGNAIKFTERGRVVLHVTRAQAPAKPGLRFEVADTGPGIGPQHRERLFRRFEQGEGARTRARYGGSGLGLAICRELTVAMGGVIEVESEPGAGTRFIVELPLPEAEPAMERPEAPARPAAAGRRPLKLLLVEDDPTVAEVIGGLLRARGHQVTHVPHALAALAEAASAPFDLALLDLDLPGLDGISLARQLRAQGFPGPLLAVTARADADAESEARQAGFDRFLRKPVARDVLVEAVEQAMPAVAP